MLATEPLWEPARSSHSLLREPEQALTNVRFDSKNGLPAAAFDLQQALAPRDTYCPGERRQFGRKRAGLNGGLSDLLISFDKKVIKSVDTNKSEPRELDICHNEQCKC